MQKKLIEAKKLLKFLIKELPINKKVYLSFVDGLIDGEDLGQTILCKKIIKIILNKKMSRTFLLYILLHEYGHAMCFDNGKYSDREDHDRNWGIAHAKAYKKWVRDY